MISLWMILNLKTVCNLCHPVAAAGIHSSVTADTALANQLSVTLNRTAVMAQKRGMLPVVNTTGIVMS